jgi:D-3-phosphoglycerate dehydrogenase
VSAQRTVVLTDHVFPSIDASRELLSGEGHVLVYDGPVAGDAELLELARDADAIIVCYATVPRSVIEEASRLRVIAKTGTGVDNVDVAAATERGIVVTNVPDYCRDEVSDHAMALLLALARRLPKLDRLVQSGSWDTGVAKPTFRIKGQTLGLVGFGRIAGDVGAKARAFGMRVLAYDPFVPAEAIAAGGCEPAPLDVVLREADFVSLHVPLTSDTEHVIDAAALRAMKPTAYLVNTARGGLVDTAALRTALLAGEIAGAGLDVLEHEPPAPDDPLLGLDNVIITPHTGFYSEDSVEELQRKTAMQVVKVLRGERPDYPVNPEVLTASTG